MGKVAPKLVRRHSLWLIYVIPMLPPPSKWWFSALTLDCVVNLRALPHPIPHLAHEGMMKKTLLTEGCPQRNSKERPCFQRHKGRCPIPLLPEVGGCVKDPKGLLWELFRIWVKSGWCQRWVKKPLVPEAEASLTHHSKGTIQQRCPIQEISSFIHSLTYSWNIYWAPALWRAPC